MVTLTDEMKESLAAAKLAFIATASKKSVPNVVPVAAFKLLDEGTLLISDQFLHKTLQNLKENNMAAVSWWGEKGGYQLKGTVTLHTDDDIFRQDVAWMKGIRPNLTPKSAVVMKIADVYQIKPGDGAGKKLL